MILETREELEICWSDIEKTKRLIKDVDGLIETNGYNKELVDLLIDLNILLHKSESKLKKVENSLQLLYNARDISEKIYN
tara:strand:- start:951 stop:1190 length:240 start_codon:yes stop_codon:yes gene_type:complete